MFYSYVVVLFLNEKKSYVFYVLILTVRHENFVRCSDFYLINQVFINKSSGSSPKTILGQISNNHFILEVTSFHFNDFLCKFDIVNTNISRVIYSESTFIC